MKPCKCELLTCTCEQCESIRANCTCPCHWEWMTDDEAEAAN